MIRCLLLTAIGISCLSASATIIFKESQIVQDIRQTAAPLIAEIPGLKARSKHLTEQAELGSLHASLKSGSPEEYVHLYMLPEQTGTESVLEIFELFAASLQDQEIGAEVVAIEFGDVETFDDYGKQKVFIRMHLEQRALAQLLMFIQISGIRTIGDIVPDESKNALLKISDQESPEGIVALEEFFSTDLLDYATDPTIYEERVKRSFGSDEFYNAFTQVVELEMLSYARLFLGGSMGEVFREHSLWPIQLASLNNMQLTKGTAENWFTLEGTLEFYTRK